jgi:hypothetical protein
VLLIREARATDHSSTPRPEEGVTAQPISARAAAGYALVQSAPER